MLGFEASSGVLRWTTDLGAFYNPNCSGLCLGPNNDIYVCGSNGDIVALDAASGSILWDKVVQTSATQPNQLVGLVCAGDGTLYGAGTTEIYAINGGSGSLEWTYPIPAGEGLVGDGFNGPDTSNPLNTLEIGPDGSLIFATNAAIYCLESVHVASLAISPTSVLGGTSATGTVTLSSAASTGGYTVSLVASGTIISVPPSVTIAAGATSASFTVSTLPVDAAVSQTVTATPGINQTATLTVLPPSLSSLVLSPPTVSGGQSSSGGVTLSGPAGPSGAIVSLKSDTNSASVPATVIVPVGKLSAIFSVSTTGVDSQATAHITATWNNKNITQSLAITPATLASVSVGPVSVQGGTASTGTVTLAGIAGPSGSTVELKSSNANAATVGANVVVPAGKGTATFAVTTLPVASNATVQISGTLNSLTESANLTVTAPTLVSLSLNPTTVPAGTSSTGTVTISGPAPSAGLAVALSSSLNSASVPSSVTVASGATSATFTVTTTGVESNTTATISATLAGLKQTASLAITASTLSTVSLNPTSVLGGSPSTGTATLTGPAGPSGAVVSLSSNSFSAKVPASVTIPFGKSSTTFTVTTTGVNAPTTDVISASFGTGSAQASLSITPVQISTVSIAPTSVQGGTSATGTVTLNGPAATGGTTVSLASTSASASVPASITIPQGQTSGTFTVQTSAVSSPTSVTVTALVNGSSAAASLTVTAPILTGLVLNPTTLAGGGTSAGTVTLSGPAPSGASVSLRSSSLSATVPASLTIPAGSTSSTFTISATSVKSSTTVQISASYGSVTLSATLTLNPLALASISVSPNSLPGGQSATGTVSLNGAAPSTGATVLLKSSLANVTVPPSVKILAGQTSATFLVKTTGVSVQKSATLTGTWNGVSVTTVVALIPPSLTGVSLSPSSVTGGSSSTGTVTLSGAAPAGGMTVKLSSGSASATVLASVVVPAGKSSATFAVKTTAVSANATAAISASLNGATQTAQLTILAPTLASLTLKPTTVNGGSISTATVTLIGPAPKGGLTISLGSSNTVATVPATLAIPAGKTSGTFTVKTSKVSAQTATTISAVLGSSKAAASLTIK